MYNEPPLLPECAECTEYKDHSAPRPCLICLHGPLPWVNLLTSEGRRVKWRLFRGLPAKQRISVCVDEKGPYTAIETSGN
jgi:hypothetical protein